MTKANGRPDRGGRDGGSAGWAPAGIVDDGSDIGGDDPEAPFQVMPSLADDEYAALVDDIREHGQRVPIDVDQHGRILDGHHRARVCAELDIQPLTRVVEVADDAAARAHAYAVNSARRHLSREQRREATARSLMADPGLSDRAHARRCGVSPDTVGRVRAELIAIGRLSDSDTRRGADGRLYAHRTVWRDPSPELLAVALAAHNLTGYHLFISGPLGELPGPNARMGSGEPPQIEISVEADQVVVHQDRRRGWDLFCDSVRDEGVRRAVIVQGTTLIDGRTRLMAAELAGRPVQICDIGPDADPDLWQMAHAGMLPELKIKTTNTPEGLRRARNLRDHLDTAREFCFAVGLELARALPPAEAYEQLENWLFRGIERNYAPEALRGLGGYVFDACAPVVNLFNPEAADPQDEEWAFLRIIARPTEDRRDVVAELRAEGMSTPAIAAAIGASVGTVHGDLSALKGSGADLPDTVTGLDGVEQ